jgi:ubiquinone/menaquinone biosynthesis C-methylase UbiE
MWQTWTAGEAPKAFAVSIDETKALEPQRHLERVAYDACPLCAGTRIPPILEADCTKHKIYRPELPPTVIWHECGDCGHVFTSGYFGDEALKVLFEKTHDNQTVGHEMESQRVVSAKMVARVARYISAGDWLDVGFGNGSLLFTAEEWGFRPVGIDLRKQNVEMLHMLGYEAHCAGIETLTDDGRFSVISMADVLEHMPFPKQGLREARRLLKPGGVMFLSMPNMDNMAWRLLHANQVNPYWGEIEHYHNFSRKRLYALLTEHGFRAEEYQISERYRLGMEVIARRED